MRKDISSYNKMQTLEEAQEESGWKLVHGDVFRPPSYSPMMLSVLAGQYCLAAAVEMGLEIARGRRPIRLYVLPVVFS